MHWKTKDGRSIPVSEMGTEHIKSALAMLKRKGFVSPERVVFYVSSLLPHGEVAIDALEREQDVAFDAPTSPFIDLFREELKRREITPLPGKEMT